MFFAVVYSEMSI